MPVYHFTLHAYRSWSPDNPRGYVRRDKGILPPDQNQARKYDERAKDKPATFTRDIQRIAIRATADFCERRKLRFHACGSDPTHLHLVLSWLSYSSWHEVMRRLKNILALELNRQMDCKHKWFVRGGNSKRVRNRAHLDHLIKTYLPDHPGLFWCEGTPLP